MTRGGILVGVPTYPGHDFCRARLVTALKSLDADVYIVWNGNSEPYGFNGFEISKYQPPKRLTNNQILCRKQNMIRKKALDGGYSHLLLVESDNIPPPDVIERLKSHDKDIVSALYFIRGRHDAVCNLDNMPGIRQQLIDSGKHETDTVWIMRECALPSIWGIKRTSISGFTQPQAIMTLWDLEDWLDLRLAGETLTEVFACGTGCVLIKREVLEQIKFRDEVEYSGIVGRKVEQLTDYIFCDLAHNAGFSVYVDLECIVQHLHIDTIELQATKKWFNVETGDSVPFEQRGKE